MKYNSYEEYMNNLLGRNKVVEEKDVPLENNIEINTEIQNIEDNDNSIVNTDIDTYDIDNNEFDDFYPEIYKIVYPVVCKRCLNVNEEVTEDLIDNITNEIYNVIEKDEFVENNKTFNNNLSNNRNFRHIPIMQNAIQEKREVRQRNFLLNDLIKILVLRELIGSGRRHNRPNHHRPPMPPRPGEFPPPLPPRPGKMPPRF